MHWFFYSTSLFIGTSKKSTEHEEEEAYDEGRQLTVLFGIVNMLTPLIASAFTTKIGRKTLLVVGTAIDVASLFVLSFSSSIPILSKIAVFSYTVGYGFSLGPIVWIYIAEILPDLGVGMSVLFNWLSAMIVVLTYPLLPDSWGDYRFITFAFCLVAGLLFMLLFVKETLGKQPNEIAEIYATTEDDSTVDLLKKNNENKDA